MTSPGFLSDGENVLGVWALDYVPDLGTPTIGLVQTPGSTQLWRPLSKYDAPYLIHKWLYSF